MSVHGGRITRGFVCSGGDCRTGNGGASSRGGQTGTTMPGVSEGRELGGGQTETMEPRFSDSRVSRLFELREDDSG